MNKMPIIFIELVPKTCWFTNVRSQVSSSDWDKLRKESYEKANYKCECCGKSGRMEAHEIWHYDDKNKIQKLHKITALCHMCHQSMHVGFAAISGKLSPVIKHISKVNNWSKTETEEYLSIVFEIWSQRSLHNWELDLSFLDNKNIKYKKINKSSRNQEGVKKLKND